MGSLVPNPLDSLNPMTGILSLCKTPGFCLGHSSNLRGQIA